MNEFLDKLQSVSPVRRRAAASLLGSCVADAASRPLHWVYDKEALASLLAERDHPEFWPESKSPFYTLPTGDRSCYNHVVEAGLEAFIRAGGEADTEVYGEVIKEKFGEGTEWQEALARRKEAYSPSKRGTWREPVPGPWIHGAVIQQLETGLGEEENTEMDAFLLTLAHLVLRVDREDVMEECVKISSLLSGRSDLVRSLGGCLRQVLLSEGQITLEEIKKAKDAKEMVIPVLDKLEEDHIVTVESLGKNCHLPGSFQGALHAFLTSRASDNRFPETVRLCIKAGGCNCSRANYAGALVGAELGPDCLPVTWLGRLNGAEHIMKQIAKAAKIV